MEEFKITADDAAEGDNFGRSVSISGDYTIVGSCQDDDDGEDSGSAYIFARNRNEWTEQAKLTADDAAANDNFGLSVSISGDYAIVGAHGNDDDGENSGAVYIFVRDGDEWTQQQKLTSDDAAEGDQFGISVSVFGDYAIVGAYCNDDDGVNSGSAYIFVHEGEEWTQQQKLTADDAAESDYFGYSVSINGDYAIIGAYWDDDDGINSGSAYIFAREGEEWTQQQKLTADDAAERDWFGNSVFINGDYAIIGAHLDDDDGINSGSAYIFVRDGEEWTQQQKLTADDAAEEDYFGVSVSINGDYAIIGAYGNDDDGDYSGSAYIFVRDDDEWTQQQKLTADDTAARDFFGNSVSINGDYAIVGAYLDDDDGAESGSAYVYASDKVKFTRIEFYENVEPTDSNPDNLIDIRQNIRFKVRVVNELDRNILMGHGTIESQTEGVEVVNERASYNNILSNQEQWSIREFEVAVAADFEPGELASFRLTMANEVEPEGPWVSNFSFPVAPLLMTGRILMDDDDNPDSDGDDDDIAEPGEIIEVIPLINNASQDVWYQVSGQLRYAGIDDYITVWDDVVGASGMVQDTWRYHFIDDQQQPIEPDDVNIQPEEDFVFEYSEDAPEARALPFDLVISGYHYEAAGDEWDEGGVLMKWSSRFLINEGLSAPSSKDGFPIRFSLSEPYPNPFNASATVRYDLPAPANVKLSMYDLSGRQLVTLVDGEMSAGRHAVELDGSGLAAGVYFVRLETRLASKSGHTAVGKLEHTDGMLIRKAVIVK